MKKVLSMEALGVKLDSTMSTMTAIEHRKQKARQMFFKDIQFYRCKGIGLFPKMKRYAERVQPCFLHGAGGWAWNKQIYTKLQQTENNFFRQMAGRSKKKNETWEQFIPEIIAHVRTNFTKVGFKFLPDKALEKSGPLQLAKQDVICMRKSCPNR